MTTARGPRWTFPALALIVLVLAAGLRFHLLGAQSLWNDEGNSLRLAQRGVEDLIDAAGRDIHPPGYYVLLRAWIAGAGTSEFALRALSALEGLIAVALATALGRALFGRSAGIAAGLLVALSPLAVYYSQETRMYAQLALLSAASMWIFVVWLRRFSAFLDEVPPPSLSLPGFLSRKESRAFFWLLALGLCNAAGMYTQYSFAFTLAAQVAWLGVWSAARHLDRTAQRALIAYGAAGLLSLALFLPWLPTAWDQVTAWPRTGVEVAASEQARAALTWITVGNTAGSVNWPVLLLPLLLAAISLIPPRGSRRKDVLWRASLPLLWAGIGVAALVVSGAYREANLKFLLPAQIALAVSLGGGLWRAWGRPHPRPLSNQVGEGRKAPPKESPKPPIWWGKW